MTDFYFLLTKFTYLFIDLTFFEFCVPNNMFFARFDTIHERNKMFKKETTLISKALSSQNLQTKGNG